MGMLAGAAGRISTGNTFGPLACADSFDHLTIPPVTARVGEDFELEGVYLAPDEVELGTVIKNVVTICMMVLGYASGLSLLCWACWACCRRQEAREVTIKTCSAHAV